MAIVRCTGPLPPPRARLDRNIVRMPDSHSRAGAFSSFTPAPLLSSLLTSATQTTRLCCKQHTCWLHSPSGPAPSLAQLAKQKCRSVYNLGTQSRSYSNCGISFTFARGREEELLQYSLLMTSDKTHAYLINVSPLHAAG